MGIKISELPQIPSGAIADENIIPTVYDGTTSKIPYDQLKFDINTIPVQTFDNTGGDITLYNYGFWYTFTVNDAFSVTLPDASNFYGKFLIIMNRDTSTALPISGILGFDGFINNIGVQEVYTCISNGDDWVLISVYSL